MNVINRLLNNNYFSSHVENKMNESSKIPSLNSNTKMNEEKEPKIQSLELVKKQYKKGSTNSVLLKKAALSSVISCGLKGFFTPFTATLDKMFFENLRFSEAATKVCKNGLKTAYKGLAPTCVNSFISPFAYLTGAIIGTNIEELTGKEPKEKSDQLSPLAKITGATLSALSTTPLENVRTQLQNGGKVVYNPKRLMRGVTPTLAIALSQLAFGFTLGEYINNIVKSHMSSETKSKIISNIIGLTIGNGLVNPAYNIARYMRKNATGGSMDALRAMNFFKNPIVGWKSFLPAIPVAVFNSVVLSVAMESGKKYYEPKQEL